jgi:hypothetical protein
MKIATFGSCLSRYIGNNYTYLFGGKIVSSVYHNRSDIFVERFIDKTAEHLSHKSIAEMLVKSKENAPIESKAEVILSNQYPDSIGQHRLKHGAQFIDLLESKKADLVILDNYMDLGAKLMTVDGTEPGSKWFIRPNDLKDPSACHPGNYLSPEEGVQSMLRIIKHIQLKMPKAKIVFCNFPHNTYHAFPERVKRTKQYEEVFNSEFDRSFMTIPCLDVFEKFQTHEKQHFKKEMYCGYAGIIRSSELFGSK